MNFLAIGVEEECAKYLVVSEEDECGVPWRRLVAMIDSHYYDWRLRRKPFPMESMLRIYYLHKWFSFKFSIGLCIWT
jgi:hypothetical protein